MAPEPTLTLAQLAAAGLSDGEAAPFLEHFRAATAGVSPAVAWGRVSRKLLDPTHPHALHRLVYDVVFRAWNDTDGPRPAWTPTDEEAAETHIAHTCNRLGFPTYAMFHRWSIEQRAEFWQDSIDEFGIRFHNRPSGIVDMSRGVETPRWLPGASMNIAESCFLAPRAMPAIVYQREDGPIASITYGDLDTLSNRFANALRDFGAGAGTAVAIAMPMTVEAVAAYLGIVKAGGVVVSIADSFAPDEIRTRMRIAGAELAVTQDVVARSGKVLPMFDKLVAAGVRACVVVARSDRPAVDLRENDREWSAFLSPDERFAARPGAPEDTTNVLFSSGTTGEPKAIPWSHTTPIKCVMDGYYHHDIQAGDVVAWPTNIGWMMGPWLIYASLVNRATMALFYGAANTREFCRFVQGARVAMLGVVPSLVKAWRARGLTDGIDWTGIRSFSSTGESSNEDDYLWLMARARYRPVIEYCGGTEIGGGYITQTLVQPASPATFSTPTLGLDLVILDEDNRPAANGELYVVPPSVGLSLTLLNRDHHEVYYEGAPKGPRGETLRRHGDQMETLPNGYFRAHGRADDTMNLGGIKVSSAEIERAVVGVHGVTDVAAIAVEPAGGGPSQLVLYVVLGAGTTADDDELGRAAQERISRTLNPLFRVHEVRVVDSLPRTASNKVMRRVLRSQHRT